MVHDAFSELVYAALLVIITHVFPVVKWTIKVAWKWFASPHLNIVEIPGSAGVGVLERILFVYCLTSGHREFIGSVLLFKAFSNWLIVQQTGAAAALPNSPTLDERHTLLSKFYTYAMGNFISLGFAILIYEIVHLWGMIWLPVIPLHPFYSR